MPNESWWKHLSEDTMEVLAQHCRLHLIDGETECEACVKRRDALLDMIADKGYADWCCGR